MNPGWFSARFLLLLCLAAGLLNAQDQEAAEMVPDRASLIARLAPKSLLLDVAQAEGLYVAVGERGHVVTSVDQGASWTQQPTPTQATLTGVQMHNKQLGWAVGHDETILKTQDGGSSWRKVRYAPEEQRPFLDILFLDQNNGLAIGAYGLLMASSDGGDNWESKQVSEEDDFHLNHITRSDSGLLYIAAEAGAFYRSRDQGLAWESLAPPYEGSFFGCLPLEGDSLLLFGLRGNMFRSDDAGDNWTRIQVGTEAMLTQGLRLADGRVVVAGLAGTLLVGDGNQFVLHQQANRLGISALVPAGNNRLMLVGQGGVRSLDTPR